MKKILTLLFTILTTVLTTGAGYVGTLPNIESEFSYLQKEHSENSSAPYSIEELDKQNEEQLKPIPRDNDSYVDIIIKKDGSTEYLNDVNDVIRILEKLRKCLNTDGDLQKFNAIVSNLIDNVEYIRKEYQDKPECNYLSYTRIQEMSQKAREVANFRTQGLATQQYIPSTSENNIYTKENLQIKLDNLLTYTTETLFILKNLE